MFLLLVFWKFLEPDMRFSLTVVSVPVNQTCRDSTLLNVVCLGLVVDSGQWRIHFTFVCVSVCFLITHQGHKSSNSECSLLIDRQCYMPCLQCFIS